MHKLITILNVIGGVLFIVGIVLSLLELKHWGVTLAFSGFMLIFSIMFLNIWVAPKDNNQWIIKLFSIAAIIMFWNQILPEILESQYMISPFFIYTPIALTLLIYVANVIQHKGCEN